MIKKSIMIEKQHRKYKNGSVSMVAVLFGTTVMSLICISFIKAITSGQNQNNMYTQSQGAYDASITGINDTQLAISECLKNASQSGDKYNACQLLLYGKSFSTTETFSDCKKTILAIEYLLFGKPINPTTPEDVEKVGIIDGESNQSYNCITVEPNNKSYQGVLRAGDDDGLVIPISASNASFVKLSYGVGMKIPTGNNAPTSTTGASIEVCDGTLTSVVNYHPYGVNDSLLNRANNLCSGKHFTPSTTSSTDFPTVGFELSQIANNFSISGLWQDDMMSTNDSTQTNTGYLMLSPLTANNLTGFATVENEYTSNYTNSNGQNILVGLAGSVDKANNSPTPVDCKESNIYSSDPGAANGNYKAINTSSGLYFNCSVYIQLPEPRGTGGRNPDFSFIRLSLPYVESDVRFEISYHTQADDNPNYISRMDATQYLVSVNGKMGERVRRTQAYIGGMTSDEIVPLWSASVGGGGITKCDDNSDQVTNGKKSGGNCENGKITDEYIKRTYKNYTDFYICKNVYYDPADEIANGKNNETHAKYEPSFQCDNRSAYSNYH